MFCGLPDFTWLSTRRWLSLLFRNGVFSTISLWVYFETGPEFFFFSRCWSNLKNVSLCVFFSLVIIKVWIALSASAFSQNQEVESLFDVVQSLFGQKLTLSLRKSLEFTTDVLLSWTGRFSVSVRHTSLPRPHSSDWIWKIYLPL